MKLSILPMPLMAGLLLAGCTHFQPSVEPQVKHLDIGGTTLAYVEQGQGATVVFVHGAAGDWRIWEPLRPHIAAQHRFVSYSRRHHDPNPPDGGHVAYANARQMDDLIAFVQALAVGPVHAVGLSAGGRVLAEAALKRPELFRTITLAGRGWPTSNGCCLVRGRTRAPGHQESFVAGGFQATGRWSRPSWSRRRSRRSSRTWGCRRARRPGRRPVARRCKRPDDSDSSPFRWPAEQGCGDRLCARVFGADGCGPAARGNP